MKRPITLLMASVLATTLAGCNPAANTSPAAQASSEAPSKPNPWSIEGESPPPETAPPAASDAPADSPPASEAAKTNPWAKTAPAGPDDQASPADPGK